jgi:hypothetical protein
MAFCEQAAEVEKRGMKGSLTSMRRDVPVSFNGKKGAECPDPVRKGTFRQGKSKEKLPDMTKALEIISRYSKMIRKGCLLV